MQTRTRSAFTTIHTEGAILPADLLQRIADGDREIGGLRPEEDYHLARGQRLNEAINQSWNHLLGAWRAFRGLADRVPAGDVGTTLTRDRWLLPLFQELNYGRLVTARAVELDGKSYAVSHAWGAVPIHLVGFRVQLDTRTAGIAGAARSSPHGLVQELLNHSDERLWGFLSNGLKLRILRDNASLTRQSYVEFDLEALMDGEAYSDFVLLWLLCHQSRVEADKPQDCWLERWSKVAQQQGIRALDQLRGGVKEAIEQLGTGFLAHPQNSGLRQRLRSASLDAREYYRQVLRLVYRLLFLFAAEDRDLLLDPNAPAEARQRYTRFYSTARLRRLAERRAGDRHADLYQALRLVLGRLGTEDGCPELGLQALGSFLFSDNSTPEIDGCAISNRSLLGAVRSLALMTANGAPRAVDFKNLNVEEMGSVYESLLELQPALDVDAGSFSLCEVGGNERRSTSSYYTSETLVLTVLDLALDPILDEATRQADPETAILNLKVCDPACGSGHFLIAAARKIAKRLASFKTGDAEPSPVALRHELRRAISRCVYGVDVNPMAVELCKVGLWMEALEPGKPLSFLDHHIQLGNSLIGATPALLDAGIPDSALDPVEGDDPVVCREYKKRNNAQRKRRYQQRLDESVQSPWDRLGNLAAAIAVLDDIGDETLADEERKQERYEQLVQSTDYLFGHLLADAWCAAFVWKKTGEFDYPITELIFREIEQNPFKLAPWMRQEIQRLQEQYGFFHWHLAFPDVFRLNSSQTAEKRQAGWSGGFDLVLGNPPWKPLSPDVKEFFSAYDPDIRFTDSRGQQQIVNRLLGDESIKLHWDEYCRMLYASVHFFKLSGAYRLFAPGNLGKGDFNIYRMFVEMALGIAGRGGSVSQVVPEGLYNGANAMAIRKHLFDECSLQQIVGFENARQLWFKNIDSRTKFCIYSARIGGVTNRFQAAFNVRDARALGEVMGGVWLDIPLALVQEFSPDALAIMEFASRYEIAIAEKMYSRWAKFGNETAGPPARRYAREVDMGTDRKLFDGEPPGTPVYEGRMVAQYDYRAKGYRSGRGRKAVWEDLPFSSSHKSIQPQWFVPGRLVPEKDRDRIQRYRIGFCDVASPTNERTLVATLIPPGCICGHKVPTITFPPEYEWAYLPWLAVANCFAMDYLARKKVSLSMSYTILDSLPFPRLDVTDPILKEICPRVLELCCTGAEMADYWNRMSQFGWVSQIASGQAPSSLLDEDSRLEVRAVLDAIVARELFGLDQSEMEHVLGTFPTVEKYERRKYHSFRTRELILAHYASF